jgi:hypothetical protein
LSLTILILIYILQGVEVTLPLCLWSVTILRSLSTTRRRDLRCQIQIFLHVSTFLSCGQLLALTHPHTPTMVFCPGCRRNFKPSGYTFHVRRSRTSACSAAHREALQAAELNTNLLDDVEDVSLFQGDFFGDYREGDLPGLPAASSDEDGEDNNVLNDDDYMDIDTDGHQGEPPDPEALSDDRQGADSFFVEHFPSSNAGAAIADEHGFIETDYDQYRTQCGSTNQYAPFASQIDWDVARWAKVHGITSTGVTELLGIKGVSLYAIYYI